MEIMITHAELTHSEEDGYVGKVHLKVAGHKQDYEVALQSKKGKSWSYGLFFLNESGSEDDIFEVEDFLEENDEAFQAVIDAAKNSLNS
ncbi:hypothetical protein DNH61_11140 [Paenibacillus sambharensis]|uniref:Uncharacterized protein n=1 Tax=Paenibacillus sambharensis TaxID=1803190 RepID=A0A2W1L6X6_9BACL|nr:hypothetical protein [Paenibacillus sambharensis]PZD95978.1 hypothetical protein DNH61_11140 [Paenibacillus sambharensis]